MNQDVRRLKVKITGAVQGVGFRPFIYRLAAEIGLKGWVNNSAQGVWIEVEGTQAQLDRFLARVQTDKPLPAIIHDLTAALDDPLGYTQFEIRHSDDVGDRTVVMLPDLATCSDCLAEIFDPTNRRYRYAFTNCTHCGPRFSIIRALPYDRPNTSMAAFTMCESCQAEYDNPADRRFHAQPNACPICGPQLAFWDANGAALAAGDAALRRAADAIRAGAVVAVKGLGGFHLMVDARSPEAVTRLRSRKRREEKPFAIMVPGLRAAGAICEVGDLEAHLLTSSQSPIVLLRRAADQDSFVAAAAEVAPGNPYLGVMLPYTPVHHLLLADLGIAVVATSGNLSDEPICIDEREAVERLAGLADYFLVHNRAIVRHVDDSIVRVVVDREMVLRRARGYAPLPVRLEAPLPPALAVGAHLKNTIAIGVGHDAFVSQHIGDLETVPALEAFEQVIASLQQAYELKPDTIVCDAHPDYLSTQYARRSGLPVITVQHHYAHVLACMAEHRVSAPVLGVSWDGTGYGMDGTVWGGEFLRVDRKAFTRAAHWRTFRLPGGEAAVREPRRSALGLLYALNGEAAFQEALPPLSAFSPGDLRVLSRLLTARLNAPETSSAGRLFDAVASLVGLRQRATYEGQAAMELEFALEGIETDEYYPIALQNTSPVVIDWEPLIRELLADVQRAIPVAWVSARFHNALVEAVTAVAQRVGLKQVILTGGCFQNRYLLERTIRRLRQAGFRPWWPQHFPPNDGSISLGQLVAAARERNKE